MTASDRSQFKLTRPRRDRWPLDPETVLLYGFCSLSNCVDGDQSLGK